MLTLEERERMRYLEDMLYAAGDRPEASEDLVGEDFCVLLSPRWMQKMQEFAKEHREEIMNLTPEKIEAMRQELQELTDKQQQLPSWWWKTK